MKVYCQIDTFNFKKGEMYIAKKLQHFDIYTVNGSEFRSNRFFKIFITLEKRRKEIINNLLK